MKSIIYFGAILMLFTSCARSYNLVNPEHGQYENKKELATNVNISYAYDSHTFAQNKPYARKERKNQYQLLSIKIENNSDSMLTITNENFIIKTDLGRDIQKINPQLYTHQVRQTPETFIFFYGLAGIGYQYEKVNGDVKTKLTYNPLPLLIGIGNAIAAGAANKKHNREVIDKHLLNKTIPPKSTFYGLIPIRELGHPELNFFLYK